MNFFSSRQLSFGEGDVAAATFAAVYLFADEDPIAVVIIAEDSIAVVIITEDSIAVVIIAEDSITVVIIAEDTIAVVIFADVVESGTLSRASLQT